MENENEIYRKVIDALAMVKTIDPAQINFETRLIRDVGLESIDIIDFIFELEKLTRSEVHLIDLFQSANIKSENGYSDLKVKDVVAILAASPS